MRALGYLTAPLPSTLVAEWDWGADPAGVMGLDVGLSSLLGLELSGLLLVPEGELEGPKISSLVFVPDVAGKRLV